MGKALEALKTISDFFGMLKANPKAQNRRNIRFLEKRIKKWERRWGKDGLDEVEKARLDDMKAKLGEMALQLD